jgi:hypothetical protein
VRKELSHILCVIGLSGIVVLGSVPISIQALLASSEQETDGEQAADSEPRDQSGEGQGKGRGSETFEPKPSDNDAEPAEAGPTTPQVEQEQQEQLVKDIIAGNELDLVNETTTSGKGSTEREMTCVSNSQGQIFCYEPLPTEENCLKPINVEDPPLCLPKGA